jgi:hypothetical protein
VHGVGRLTPRGRLRAAVLACGGADVAVLSHRSAASAWDHLPTSVVGSHEISVDRAVFSCHPLTGAPLVTATWLDRQHWGTTSIGGELPVACSLTGARAVSRRESWLALGEHGLLEASATDRGVRLAYVATPAVLAELRELAGLERECCG